MVITKKEMWAAVKPAQNNQNEISFFDVKELYDAAFEEQARPDYNMKRVNALMAQAEKLDAAYRAQLAARKSGPFTVYGATAQAA